MGRRQIDWAEIETYYLTHDDSLPAVADMFGVSRKAVENHSMVGQWSKRRREARDQIAAEACKLVMAARSKDVAAELIGMCKSAGLLTDRILAVLEDEKAFFRRQVVVRNRDGSTEAVDTVSDQPDVRAMRDMAQAVRDLANTLRSLYGIPTITEEATMELQKARLALEKQKYEEAKEETGPQEMVVRFMNAEAPAEEASGQEAVEVQA